MHIHGEKIVLSDSEEVRISGPSSEIGKHLGA